MLNALSRRSLTQHYAGHRILSNCVRTFATGRGVNKHQNSNEIIDEEIHVYTDPADPLNTPLEKYSDAEMPKKMDSHNVSKSVHFGAVSSKSGKRSSVKKSSEAEKQDQSMDGADVMKKTDQVPKNAS
eukprot:GILJ01013366.1.p1 GENE.GILJ01013366.1~~GILJ01013366.1.p1  ORF type:complete len:128 (+),score=15.49 GILJ01013366.1:121-504(+)